jgi:hypothetical protein
MMQLTHGEQTALAFAAGCGISLAFEAADRVRAAWKRRQRNRQVLYVPCYSCYRIRTVPRHVRAYAGRRCEHV